MGEGSGRLSNREGADRTVTAVERLIKDLKVQRNLSEFGVTEADILRLAEGVMKVTRLLANNPRAITQKTPKKSTTRYCNTKRDINAA